jgi:hypothetical protein
LDYEAFESAVRAAAERRGLQGGLISIPELRRTVATQELSRHSFDAYVLRMHREGRIHLMTHVEPEKLPEPVRDDCLVHPEGPLLYWIRLV